MFAAGHTSWIDWESRKRLRGVVASGFELPLPERFQTLRYILLIRNKIKPWVCAHLLPPAKCLTQFIRQHTLTMIEFRRAPPTLTPSAFQGVRRAAGGRAPEPAV